MKSRSLLFVQTAGVRSISWVTALTHWGWNKWSPFPDDIFKCIFLNENVLTLHKNSLKFVYWRIYASLGLNAVFGRVQSLAHLVSRVSRPQFCWGLAIFCDPPFFSGYIEFGGVVVKFNSSVEIALYLLTDFLLHYVTLFQSRDIVKNLVSL